jgi:FG-GAP repeat
MKWQLRKVAGVTHRRRTSEWLLALVCLGAALTLGMGPFSSGALAASAEGTLAESELMAATGGAEAEEGPAAFGNSVALSADGQTALVGGPFDAEGKGAAWVFVRKEGVWTQVAKLTAGEEEAGAGHLGRAVALSANGTTALVGAPADHGGVGAAWVFQLMEGTWSRQARLAGSGKRGVGYFGRAVALSGDGNTALIGAPGEAQGAGGAWAYTRSGGSWQGEEQITDREGDPEARFGKSVSLSADGSTALVGGLQDEGGKGAAWVFERTGGGVGSWAQQGGKLESAEESADGQFGGSVALSPDGSTALVAAPTDGEGAGAVWVFVRSGSQWSQQGSKLLSSLGSRERDFGSAVALSGDGDLALIGEATARGRRGGAWMFERTGASWSRLGFFAFGQHKGQVAGEQFGSSVAISADGETSLIGALGNEAETNERRIGAAWVFIGAPVLTEPPREKEESTSSSTSQTGGQSAETAGQSANGQVLAISQTHTSSCGLRLVSSRLSVDRKGRAAVRLRSTGMGRCTGKVTLSIAQRARETSAKRARIHKVTIGGSGFALVAGRNGTVRLKLTRTGRSLLRAGHGKLTVSLRLQRSTPAPAQARSATAHLVLQKPKKSVKLAH